VLPAKSSLACPGIRTLKVAKISLLVKLGLIQTERVHNIDLGLLVVINIVTALFGRSVGPGVEALAANGDLGAVGLVDDAVDFLEVVRVRDQLVVGDDVLRCIRGQYSRTSAG